MREVPHISLFTGAGGLDLGLERATLPGVEDGPRLAASLHEFATRCFLRL